MAQGESNTVDVVAEKDELILLLFNQIFEIQNMQVFANIARNQWM